ncbi:MAG: SIMPL domain-containing protein [Candidatus Micrarchaeota archaeon]|nr:SIMPL domain-containing protein [Candidatus Micrarchaeota archaeon]
MGKGLDISSNIALILSIIALLVALDFAIGGLPTQSQEVISATASGVAYGYPDRAVLYLTANATGSDAAGAGANLSTIVNSLNSTLSPFLNRNISLLQTQSFNLYKQQVPVCGSNSTGAKGPIMCVNTTVFVATESIVVNLPNIRNVSAALIGISNVDGVSVQQATQSFSDQSFSQLMQQALTNAMENATDEAQVISGSSQLQILNITIQNYPLIYAGQGAAAQTGNIYFPGRSGITRTVYVKFAVK